MFIIMIEFGELSFWGVIVTSLFPDSKNVLMIVVLFVLLQTWSCACWTMTLKVESHHSMPCSTISSRKLQMKEPTPVHLHPPLLPWTTHIQPPQLALFLALVKYSHSLPMFLLQDILKNNHKHWFYAQKLGHTHTHSGEHCFSLRTRLQQMFCYTL